eukprot:gene21206-biopygen5650
MGLGPHPVERARSGVPKGHSDPYKSGPTAGGRRKAAPICLGLGPQLHDPEPVGRARRGVRNAQ